MARSTAKRFLRSHRSDPVVREVSTPATPAVFVGHQIAVVVVAVDGKVASAEELGQNDALGTIAGRLLGRLLDCTLGVLSLNKHKWS